MESSIMRFVDSYRIYIDTCSLLEDSAIDFLKRSRPFLQASGKKLYLIDDVVGELRKHRKIGKDDLPIRADRVLKKLMR